MNAADNRARHWRRLWPVLAVLALAVLARTVTFRGFSASDDADYARVAWSLAQGEFPPSEAGVPPHYPSRLGLVAPVALCFRLFGVTEPALLLFPLLMSAASLALAYALGRAFFSRRVGLIALLLFAVMPIDCQFATWLLTDVPASFWAGAGMLALVLGHRAESNGRKALAGFAAAGGFALAWLTRTQVAHLAPFVVGALLLWAWRDRRNLWLAGAAALGVAACVLAEGLLYLATQGDFFYVLHAAERTYQAHGQWYFREGGIYGWEPGHYAFGLARRLLKMGPQALFFNVKFAFVPLVALVACAHALLWRRKEFLFPAAWFLWMALIYNFGSASLKHYEPLPWIDAYLVPVLLPGVVVVAGWLNLMFSHWGSEPRVRRERRFWAATAALIIALGALAGLYHFARQGVGCKGTRAAAAYLRAAPSPEEPLYADAMTLRGLEFYFGYRAPAPLRAYDGLDPARLPARARVLINPPELQRLRDQVDYVAPAWLDKPPAAWTVEKRWGDTVLYRVP